MMIFVVLVEMFLFVRSFWISGRLVIEVFCVMGVVVGDVLVGIVCFFF